MQTDAPSPADLRAKLAEAAERESAFSRQMAEAKSLRQHDCDPPRADLYMWPKPEDTLYGEAMRALTAAEAKAGRLSTLLQEAVEDYEAENGKANNINHWSRRAALDGSNTHD